MHLKIKEKNSFFILKKEIPDHLLILESYNFIDMNLFIIYQTFCTIETLVTKQKKTAIHSVWLDKSELDLYLRKLKQAESKLPDYSRPKYQVKTIESKSVKPIYYSGNNFIEVQIEGQNYQIKTIEGTTLTPYIEGASLYLSRSNNPKTKTITPVEFQKMKW
jgi:hypothetical protein